MSYINEETGDFGLTEQQIRSSHPETIFPTPFEPDWPYAWVQNTAAQAFDSTTHRVKETGPQKVDGVWHQRWALVALTPTEIAERLAMRKAQLLAAATDQRWTVETGGIDLPGGLRIDTARADQDAITRVLVNAQAAGITDVRFKAATGWVELSLDQLRQIASAVAKHVQACYDAEHAHHVGINALTSLSDASAYDVQGGWPGTK